MDRDPRRLGRRRGGGWGGGRDYINATLSPPEFPSLISLVVSVDVKHHVYLLTTRMVPIITMGSNESRFNVSPIVKGQSHKDSVHP